MNKELELLDTCKFLLLHTKELTEELKQQRAEIRALEATAKQREENIMRLTHQINQKEQDQVAEIVRLKAEVAALQRQIQELNKK